MDPEFIQKVCKDCGNCIPLLTDITTRRCDFACYHHADAPSYYQKIAVLCSVMPTCPLHIILADPHNLFEDEVNV